MEAQAGNLLGGFEIGVEQYLEILSLQMRSPAKYDDFAAQCSEHGLMGPSPAQYLQVKEAAVRGQAAYEAANPKPAKRKRKT